MALPGLQKGDADCTTGLSGRMYTKLVAADDIGFTDPLTANANKMIKAICFALAESIVEEVTENGYAAIDTSLGQLQVTTGLGDGTDPPKGDRQIPLK
jgi:hypothetical protein